MQAPFTASVAPIASSSPSQEIEITVLPAEWSAADLKLIVAKYKAFRLHALQSAPKAFATTYGQEAEFPDERWPERLTNEEAVHFIATMHDDEDPATISGHEDKLAKTRRTALERDWVGSVVLVKEFEGLAHRQFSAGTQYLNTQFHLNALFVEPAARREGVGRRLVFAAREYARREVKEGEFDRAQISTLVDTWNRGAIALYTALGFVKSYTDKYVVDGEQREAATMDYVLE